MAEQGFGWLCKSIRDMKGPSYALSTEMWIISAMALLMPTTFLLFVLLPLVQPVNLSFLDKEPVLGYLWWLPLTVVSSHSILCTWFLFFFLLQSLTQHKWILLQAIPVSQGIQNLEKLLPSRRRWERRPKMWMLLIPALRTTFIWLFISLCPFQESPLKGANPVAPVTPSEGEDSGDTCAICFEEWTNAGGHRLSALRCGHLFGYSCIERWLKGQPGKCPQVNGFVRDWLLITAPHNYLFYFNIYLFTY